jgi:hypothetical protein
MEDRQWWYTGRRSKRDFDDEWMVKTNDFLEFAWANSRGHLLVCVPAQNVTTGGELARMIWADIFYTMDLPKTIPCGSTMVKHIV